jgi:hypothetical protein
MRQVSPDAEASVPRPLLDWSRDWAASLENAQRSRGKGAPGGMPRRDAGGVGE